MKDKTKLYLLELLGFILSILPLALTLLLRREIYFPSVKGSVKITAGLITVIILFVMKAIGAMRVPKLITAFALTFVLSFLLSALLSDLCLLSGMALLGEFLELLFVSHKIKALREKIQNEKISEAVVEKLSHTVFEGNGRI